jgi:ribonuclease P protein component
VVASLSHAAHPRAGLVVPKHGRTAVERNLLKRRLREIARTTILPGAPPIDLVITTRPSAYRLTFTELLALGARVRQEIERVAPRLATAPKPGRAADSAS